MPPACKVGPFKTYAKQPPSEVEPSRRWHPIILVLRRQIILVDSFLEVVAPDRRRPVPKRTPDEDDKSKPLGNEHREQAGQDILRHRENAVHHIRAAISTD